MADEKPKIFNPANKSPINFKPVLDSLSGEKGKLPREEANTPTAPKKFRAVNPTELSGKSPGSSSHNDSDDPPKFRAVSSKEETQGSGVPRTNDDKPLIKAVNPGSVPARSSASLYRDFSSAPQDQSEEWNEHLTSIVTILRGFAYKQSRELMEALGGGGQANSSQDRSVSTTAKQDEKTGKPAGGSNISPKSGCLTLLLCLFLGVLGAHRFYTGYIGMGFLYLFTGGLFLIGWIIDLFNILSGFFRDSKKRLIKF